MNDQPQTEAQLPLLITLLEKRGCMYREEAASQAGETDIYAEKSALCSYLGTKSELLQLDQKHLEMLLDEKGL